MPTQTSEMSVASMASVADVVARRVPLSWPCVMSRSTPGSTIGEIPRLMPSTLSALTSTATTVCPSEVRQAADTVPT